MANKENKINITQQDGFIKIIRNGEYEQGYDFNKVLERIKDDKMSAVGLANWIAEMLNDSLNCKSATATLNDLNDTASYRGTYFENIDQFTD